MTNFFNYFKSFRCYSLLSIAIFLGFTSNLAYGSDDLYHQQLAEVIDFCQNNDQATDLCYLLAEDFSAYQDLNEPLQLDDNQLHYVQSAAVLSIPVFLRYLPALANLAKNNMIIASTIALLAGAMVFKKYNDSFLESLIINVSNASDFDQTSEQSSKEFSELPTTTNNNNLQKGPDHENNNLAPVLPSQEEQTEKQLIKENDRIFFDNTPKSYVNFNVLIEGKFIGRCSGVHIGDGVILTAKHCIGQILIIGQRKDHVKIAKLIYHALDPETQQSSVEVVDADKDDFVYHQEVHPSIDIGLIFTDLKKPIAGSAEIVGQSELNTNYNSLDDFAKAYPKAKTYLTGGVAINSSLDVSEYINNRVVRSQPVDLQKHQGVSSSLISFIYNYVIKHINQSNDSQVLADDSLSDSLSDNQKIEVVFEVLCQQMIEIGYFNDHQVGDYCKNKDWMGLLNTFNHGPQITADVLKDRYSLLFILFTFIYSKITASIPEGFTPYSKFHMGDSGGPIYIEQDEKEVVAGVISHFDFEKVPQYQGDRLEKIKQIMFISKLVLKNTISKIKSNTLCSDHVCAYYLHRQIPWIVETKSQVILNK